MSYNQYCLYIAKSLNLLQIARLVSLIIFVAVVLSNSSLYAGHLLSTHFFIIFVVAIVIVTTMDPLTGLILSCIMLTICFQKRAEKNEFYFSNKTNVSSTNIQYVDLSRAKIIKNENFIENVRQEQENVKVEENVDEGLSDVHKFSIDTNANVYDPKCPYLSTIPLDDPNPIIENPYFVGMYAPYQNYSSAISNTT